MVAGAPRTVSFPPKEMIELGEEMIKWVKINNPLHISEFYSVHKDFMYEEWETMIKRPEFVRYYEKAMLMIGKQYLDKNSNVREGASQRWQRVYFKDLKRQEYADMAYEQDLKNKSDNPVPPTQLQLDYEAVIARQQAEIASLKKANNVPSE